MLPLIFTEQRAHTPIPSVQLKHVRDIKELPVLVFFPRVAFHIQQARSSPIRVFVIALNMNADKKARAPCARQRGIWSLTI